MIETVSVDEGVTLDEYAAHANLMSAVQDLRAEAAAAMPQLRDRKLWMVNSTAQGGGVAEMLPRMITLLRDLGIATEWAVLTTDRAPFFDLTKRLHNMIHGEGAGAFSDADRALYAAVSRESADALREKIGPDDILLIHDPQPLGMGAILKQELGNLTLWRCHIGLDETNAATDAAWDFLRPHTERMDHAVFSAPEYIPSFLSGRASIIHPAIDPLTPKNQDLSTRALTGILCNSQLAYPHQPVLYPPYEHPVMRLRGDGTFAAATIDEEIGLMYRPMVVQISRWDRLKGYLPLMRGFCRLQEQAGSHGHHTPIHRRRIELTRLVLAGPEPAAIQDDPEATEMLDELVSEYRALDPHMQRRIAMLSLPMADRRRNALIVNALQRCGTIVAQNSLREGFGLTATEAMWKRAAVMGTHACGLRQQISDGMDGRLLEDPEDPEAIAAMLDDMLARHDDRQFWGRNGQRRVHSQFLIFAQLSKWLRLMATHLSGPRRAARERRSTMPPS